MKCDDDTFVRVDAVIKEINKIPENRSLYVGNINYYHKPLRNGKWAVTYEVIVWSSFLNFSFSNLYVARRPNSAIFFWQSIFICFTVKEEALHVPVNSV